MKTVWIENDEPWAANTQIQNLLIIKQKIWQTF